MYSLPEYLKKSLVYKATRNKQCRKEQDAKKAVVDAFKTIRESLMHNLYDIFEEMQEQLITTVEDNWKKGKK